MYDAFEDKELEDYISSRLVELDPLAEPWTDEDTMWCLEFENEEGVADVLFSLTDSVTSDGTEHSKGGGYNVGWSAARQGGELLANLFPYNRTSRVWTLDKGELWYRAEGVINALEEWVEENNYVATKEE